MALHGKEKDPSVPFFGEYLRRERELRDISLREIVDETKISYRYLEALEQDNRSRLPAEVFIKGFVRSYANYIGLDADEAILRYQEYQKTQEITGASRAANREFPSTGPRETRHISWSWIAVPLLIVLAAILFYLGNARQKGRVEAPPPAPPLGDQVEEAVPPLPKPGTEEERTVPEPLREQAPAPASVVTDTTPSHAPPAGLPPIRVSLLALEKTWLTVDIDSDRHYDVTLQADEEIHFDLVDSMRLTVGNAGGLLVRSNGRTFGPLGDSGQVIKNFLMTRKDLAGDPSE